MVISTEMTEEQIVSRILANITGVHSYRILTGKYHDEFEADVVASAKDRLSRARMSIYDDIYRLEDIETAFRKADLQGGINVGWIDYVQNCRWPDAKSQYQEQSEIAKRFQALAKDVRATLICLSQVSNDVGRGNTDNLELKGAGEWAAVSDIGLMLKRHVSDKHCSSARSKRIATVHLDWRSLSMSESTRASGKRTSKQNKRTSKMPMILIFRATQPEARTYPKNFSTHKKAEEIKVDLKGYTAERQAWEATHGKAAGHGLTVRISRRPILTEQTTWRIFLMSNEKRKSGIAGLVQGIRIENRMTRPDPLRVTVLKKRHNLTRFLGINQGLLELSGQPEAEAPRMKMTYSGAYEFARRVK